MYISQDMQLCQVSAGLRLMPCTNEFPARLVDLVIDWPIFIFSWGYWMNIHVHHHTSTLSTNLISNAFKGFEPVVNA
jgi:hypothetical protein